MVTSRSTSSPPTSSAKAAPPTPRRMSPPIAPIAARLPEAPLFRNILFSRSRPGGRCLRSDAAADSRCRTVLGSGRKVRLRSEEHTSELQSRGHLVCRLLLEKKKKQKKNE